MININPLDLKIHINDMKQKAKALKQEAKDKLVRAEAIEKEACALEDACPDCGMRECCCFDDGEEPACLICGGEGLVDGSDHLDWDEDGYDDVIRCTSCKGSGLAKDMTWC